MLWIHTPVPAVEVEELSKRAGVGPVLAELLLRGGHRDPELAADFLHPDLSRLEDPFLVGNVLQGVARLKAAIEARERVIVLGDYDVDGVSSTALLVLVLRRFGLDPSFVVPRRSEDGYGLSRSAIDRALEAGRPGLFVALDCGTNSHDEVD
jgi:single-stranded-DNA-specific exonuclease